MNPAAYLGAVVLLTGATWATIRLGEWLACRWVDVTHEEGS